MLGFEALCLSTQFVISLSVKTMLKYAGFMLLFAQFVISLRLRRCVLWWQRVDVFCGQARQNDSEPGFLGLKWDPGLIVVDALSRYIFCFRVFRL